MADFQFPHIHAHNWHYIPHAASEYFQQWN